MALITTIRERYGKWLFGILAVALILFILFSDTFGISGFLGTSAPSFVGSINGKRIEINEFQKATSEAQNKSQKNSSAQENNARVWYQFVTTALMETEMDAAGISVSKKEVDEMMYSDDPAIKSQVITENFGKATGTEIKAQIQKAEKENKKEVKEALKSIRDEVAKQRKIMKLNALVSKGVYFPTWLAQKINKRNSTQMNLNFVRVPYTAINDKEANISDSDLNTYIAEHANEFSKEPSAVIEYVTFDVKPSQSDSAVVYTDLGKKISEFGTTKDDSSFVVFNNGVYPTSYRTKEEYKGSSMVDTFFTGGVGRVYGPYIEQGYLVISKILGRKMIPDSVRASHILLQPKTKEDYDKNKATLEQVKKDVEAGKISFAAAADSLGTDGTKGKGGDLGFFSKTAMVQPFAEYCFNEGEVGKLKILETQFGVHLVVVTGSKGGNQGAKVAHIAQPLVPSKLTTDRAQQQALQFISGVSDYDAFKKEATAQKLNLGKAANIGENDYQIAGIGAGDGASDIVKWAYDSKANEVAKKVFNFRNDELNAIEKFVCVALVNRKGEGIPTAASASDDIRTQAINAKKGEMIAAKLKGQSNLQGIASTFNVKVDSMPSVTVGMGRMSPKVLGTGLALKDGQTSAPIIDKDGVYVVQLISKMEGPEADPVMARRSTVQQIAQEALQRAVQALKEKATIVDNRRKLF